LRQGFHELVSERLDLNRAVILGLRAAKSPEPMNTAAFPRNAALAAPFTGKIMFMDSGLRPSACPGKTAKIFKP
jgi:hypothetical protein